MPGYRKANVDASAKGMDRIKGGVPFWKPPAGTGEKFKTTRLRILPPREDHPDDTYYFWVALHGNLPGAGRPILCPKKMNGDPCSACDYGNVLWNAGNKDAARDFFSSWRACVNMVALNADGSCPEDATIIPWAISKETFTSLDSKLGERPKAQRDITDVENGYDVLLARKGTDAQHTKYEIRCVDTASPVADEILAMMDETDDHATELWPLDRLYPTTDSEKIRAFLEAPKTPKNLITGGADAFADDEDDDDFVEGAFTAVEEEEEDDDLPWEEEEEPPVAALPEPPKPATRGPRTSGPTAGQREARSRLEAALAGVN